MKGIVLAGGSGTRLHPMTLSISKQLLPIYNKPMIYYPISVLMLAGIRDILIISTPYDLPYFKKLLNNGEQLGVKFSYEVQQEPNGLAEAFIIGKDFIGKDSVCLILGDNIFYGNGLESLLQKAIEKDKGATLFGYKVRDPERYGVVSFSENGKPHTIVEKPTNPLSDIAVTGLYFYDNRVVDIAKSLKPSPRGELEITDINKKYLETGEADIQIMGQGFTWLDTGTYETLLQASHFVQVIEERQGTYIACLEEIAFRKEFIGKKELELAGNGLGNSPYGKHLLQLAAQ
jgi:glucose-1-phosphate thymidylyltransferase